MSEEFISEIEYPFTQLPTKIWEMNLQPTEFLVLTRIIYRAGLRGQCFESRANIAQACNISPRSVSSAFSTLEMLNIISIRSRKAEMKPNLIRINSLAQWQSKMQSPSEKELPSASIAQGLVQPLQEASATIAHGTRSLELDPIELDSFLNTVATAHAAAPQEPEKEVVIEVLDSKPEKQKSAGSLIFEAYQDAYIQRYKIEPLRNAKTNSICSQIAKQLPLDEAIALMHFFVQQNVAFYLQRSHAIQLALGDLQALRTNMLQNKAMSSRQAFLADKQQAQKNIVDSYLENREKYLNMFK